VNQTKATSKEDGSVKLLQPEKSSKNFSLLWDGHTVRSPYVSLSSSLTQACQATLNSHAPLANVIPIELVEDIKENGFPLRVPSIYDPYTDRKDPMWGENFRRTGVFLSVEAGIELQLNEPWMPKKDPTDLEIKLCEKIAQRAVAGPLIGDLAAKLNRRATEEILRFISSVGKVDFDQAFREHSERLRGGFARNIRSYRNNVKAMFHPEALGLISAPKFVGQKAWENASEKAPICLNWDMPEPSESTVEVLVGDFSQLMLVLKPIEIAWEGSDGLWEINARTQALCGIWSAVSPSIIKATVEAK